MKRQMFLMAVLLLTACSMQVEAQRSKFVTVQGTDLIQPNGEKLFIVGTNLGNWLNPEGYMFGFSRTNSAWMIDLMFREMVDPDATADFWREFKDNYITRDDIHLCGMDNDTGIRV